MGNWTERAFYANKNSADQPALSNSTLSPSVTSPLLHDLGDVPRASPGGTRARAWQLRGTT